MKVYPFLRAGDLCVDVNVTPNVFRLMHSFTGVFAVPYKVGPDFQSVGPYITLTAELTLLLQHN